MSAPFLPFRLYFVFDTVELACMDILARDELAAKKLGDMIAAQSLALGMPHCKARVALP